MELNHSKHISTLSEINLMYILENAYVQSWIRLLSNQIKMFVYAC